MCRVHLSNKFQIHRLHDHWENELERLVNVVIVMDNITKCSGDHITLSELYSSQSKPLKACSFPYQSTANQTDSIKHHLEMTYNLYRQEIYIMHRFSEKKSTHFCAVIIPYISDSQPTVRGSMKLVWGSARDKGVSEGPWTKIGICRKIRGSQELWKILTKNHRRNLKL